MKVQFPTVIAMTMFTVLFAHTAGATGDNGKSAAAFKKLDADNNGFISRKEAKANPEISDSFGEADSNQDDKLSLAEYEDMDLDE